MNEIKCPYCVSVNGHILSCGHSFEADGFVRICTRELNHPGEHIACGTETHDMARKEREANEN